MTNKGRVVQVVVEIDNVGDVLAPILTERLFGVSTIRVFGTLPAEARGRPVLAGLGSHLAYHGEWALRVWGCGYEPGYAGGLPSAEQGDRSLWRFHAVRGHLTRAILNLPTDIPIGDPAILTPRIYTPRETHRDCERYFTHCMNDDLPVIPGIEVHSTRMDPFAAIDLITSSRFVFTEALHVAILAHAYGVPWAWILNGHLDGMVKWFDWFSSIGTRPHCGTLNELGAAREWFHQNASGFVRLDEDRLLQSFPKDVVW